jgi:single-strand DNA-binding protein
MSNYNKVTLLGRLSNDVEFSTTTNGKNTAKFRLAVNETWKDYEGQKRERAYFFNVVCWDALACNCRDYIEKGRQVLVDGKLTERSYTDKSDIKRYFTEIVAHNVVFLGNGDDKPKEKVEDKTVYTADDVPF